MSSVTRPISGEAITAWAGPPTTYTKAAFPEIKAQTEPDQGLMFLMEQAYQGMKMIFFL